MKVLHEEPIILTTGSEVLQLILGVYYCPIIGKIYTVRNCTSSIITLGVLPNNISDTEAVSLALRLVTENKSRIVEHLIKRTGSETQKLVNYKENNNGNPVE